MLKLLKQGSCFIFVLIILFLLSACTVPTNGNASPSAGVISVVAAEDFYGSIARQIGGEHVNVTSILSDPNVDPHSYEPAVKDATSVAKAKLVIANGGGYDSWIDKLLSSSASNDRTVIKVFDIAQVKLEDNEHVWYSIENAGTAAQGITDNLKKLDTAHAASYDSNLATFKQSLQQIQTKIADMKAKYAGTPVALTETIFMYQAGPLDLKVLTPPAFQQAVTEGEDPPASAIAEAETQIKEKQVKILIYNQQNDNTITARLRESAKSLNIPIVTITETMPKGKTYQTWMLDQLTSLETALGK
jgi:zinc/manganese transport system substrate-binding protein